MHVGQNTVTFDAHWLSHLAREFLQTRLGGVASVPLGFTPVRLRDLNARSVLLEAPAVVGTGQRAIALNPSLGEWREPVRAAIRTDLPLALVDSPNHKPAAEQLHPVGSVCFEVAFQLYRPPVLVPIEELVLEWLSFWGGCSCG